MDNEKFILKVWNKKTGQKFVTVPKKSSINAGDYVAFQKVNTKKADRQ